MIVPYQSTFCFVVSKSLRHVLAVRTVVHLPVFFGLGDQGGVSKNANQFSLEDHGTALEGEYGLSLSLSLSMRHSCSHSNWVLLPIQEPKFFVSSYDNLAVSLVRSGWQVNLVFYAREWVNARSLCRHPQCRPLFLFLGQSNVVSTNLFELFIVRRVLIATSLVVNWKMWANWFWLLF